MCRINPRIDFAFKKLFGSEGNKDLLISLINAIVSEKDKVSEIELKNPYNLAAYQSGKMSILDIKARDKSGRWFNIEMQIGQDLNFDKRAIYYWAKLVTDQISEGQLYKELAKTISINILDFDFIPEPENFHSCYKIINTATGKEDRLHDIFEMHYIELKKFRKEYHEISDSLDRWTAFLTKAHELNKTSMPRELADDAKILKAVEVVDRMFDEEERRIYEDRMHAIIDIKSMIASAKEEGMEAGMEAGIEKGIEKGMEKGREKNKRETVLTAYEQGLDIKVICKILAMEEKEVMAILKKADMD